MKSNFIPIKLNVIQEVESAKASLEDLEKPDLSIAELAEIDKLFNTTSHKPRSEEICNESNSGINRD